jgi:DNA-binding transcriptional MerR regulator
MISEEKLSAEEPRADDVRPTVNADAPVEAGGDGFSRIEQVAARTGLTKRTLRYYEEIGLLAPPTRTEGGYRLYSEADVQHLQRIKRLRDLLGFSLAEIREIAQAEEQREQVKAAYAAETDPRTRIAWLERAQELTRQQLALVEEKLAGLQEMQANLTGRLEAQERRHAELVAQLEEDGKDEAKAR